jgi:5-methylcytosine-specific restriction endonuclease McrA
MANNAHSATRLLEKFGYTCAYCGRGETPFELDHIQPRSRGGNHRV